MAAAFIKSGIFMGRAKNAFGDSGAIKQLLRASHLKLTRTFVERSVSVFRVALLALWLRRGIEVYSIHLHFLSNRIPLHAKLRRRRENFVILRVIISRLPTFTARTFGSIPMRKCILL